jgi:hypothetical protein
VFYADDSGMQAAICRLPDSQLGWFGATLISSSVLLKLSPTPHLRLLLLCQALDYTAAFTAAVAGLAAFNAQGALAACGSSGEHMRGFGHCT